MRIYRPQTTKPIPPNAKVNNEKGIVTYKGRGGQTRRAVLTNGGRMRQ